MTKLLISTISLLLGITNVSAMQMGRWDMLPTVSFYDVMGDELPGEKLKPTDKDVLSGKTFQ